MKKIKLIGLVLLVFVGIGEVKGQAYKQQGIKLVGTGYATGSSTNVPHQGSAIALSADGNTALVGGNGDSMSLGACWVFTRTGGVWSQQGAKLVGSKRHTAFGTDVRVR